MPVPPVGILLMINNLSLSTFLSVGVNSLPLGPVTFAKIDLLRNTYIGRNALNTVRALHVRARSALECHFFFCRPSKVTCPFGHGLTFSEVINQVGPRVSLKDKITCTTDHLFILIDHLFILIDSNGVAIVSGFSAVHIYMPRLPRLLVRIMFESSVRELSGKTRLRLMQTRRLEIDTCARDARRYEVLLLAQIWKDKCRLMLVSSKLHNIPRSCI